MRDRKAGRLPVAVSLERRRVCRWLLVPAAQLLVPSAAWANVSRIASARMWPAQEYTRVVLEAPDFVAHRVATLKDPHRIVLELDGIRLTPELSQLPMRVQAADPYIAAIRFGTRAPDTLRIVFELKTETRPQVFALKPVAEYGFRVVLDLYPLTPLDPMMALLKERGEPAAAEPRLASPLQERAPDGRPDARTEAKAEPRAFGRRRITIALDPGTWRRGSGRRRPARHLRKKCDARDRPQAEAHHRRRARHARHADAR
jgi:N-acetylmuramoyl-L-alanine amidase